MFLELNQNFTADGRKKLVKTIVIPLQFLIQNYSICNEEFFVFCDCRNGPLDLILNQKNNQNSFCFIEIIPTFSRRVMDPKHLVKACPTLYRNIMTILRMPNLKDDRSYTIQDIIPCNDLAHSSVS